jgi:hypothetical protein
VADDGALLNSGFNPHGAQDAPTGAGFKDHESAREEKHAGAQACVEVIGNDVQHYERAQEDAYHGGDDASDEPNGFAFGVDVALHAGIIEGRTVVAQRAAAYLAISDNLR